MSLAIQKQRRYLLLISGVVFLLIAAGLLAYSLSGLWQRHEVTTKPQSKIVSAKPITQSTDKPDETPPIAPCSSYSTAVNHPKEIKISSLGISGCIQQVGIDQNEAVAVPTNIHLAGWFTGSVPPGEKGVSLVDGHVLGRYNDAIFGSLKDVSKGDSIEITRRDGKQLRFQVADVATYSEKEAATKMLEQLPEAERQLTLVTCTGSYNQNSKTYDKRVVVRAYLK